MPIIFILGRIVTLLHNKCAAYQIFQGQFFDLKLLKVKIPKKIILLFLKSTPKISIDPIWGQILEKVDPWTVFRYYSRKSM